MRGLPLLILLGLILVAPAQAQERYPFPDNLSVITVSNAAQVGRLMQLDFESLGINILFPSLEALRISYAGDSTWYNLRTGTERVTLYGPPFFVDSSTNGEIFLYTIRLIDAPSTVVQVWRISPLLQSRTLVNMWSSGWATEIDLSDDGTLLIFTNCASQDGCPLGEIDELVVWNVLANREIARWSFENPRLQELVLSPDNALLVTADQNGVRIWDFASILQGEITPIEIGHINYHDTSMYAGGIAFSPDGASALIYGTSSYLFDTEVFLQGDEQHSSILSDSSVIRSAWYGFFSPDSSLLLTYDDGYYSNNWVRLWDVGTKTQVAYLSAQHGVFSPNTSVLASSLANVVTLWDVSMLRSGIFQSLTTLEIGDINTQIEQVAFNPDGTLLFVKTSNSVSVWGVQ